MKHIIFTILAIFMSLSAQANSEGSQTDEFEIKSEQHSLKFSTKENTVIAGAGYKDIFNGTISADGPGETVMKIILQKLALKALQNSGVDLSGEEIILVEPTISIEGVIDLTRAWREFKGAWTKSVNIGFYTCIPPKEATASEILKDTTFGDLWDGALREKLIGAKSPEYEAGIERCRIKFSPDNNCYLEIERGYNKELKYYTFKFALDPKTCDSPYLESRVEVEAVPSVVLID